MSGNYPMNPHVQGPRPGPPINSMTRDSVPYNQPNPMYGGASMGVSSHVPAMTGQMNKMSVGPPPSNHTPRYPGVSQPNSYPLGPPGGMGGQPVAPLTGNMIHTSHHPSSNPSTGQSPPFPSVSMSSGVPQPMSGPHGNTPHPPSVVSPPTSFTGPRPMGAGHMTGPSPPTAGGTPYSGIRPPPSNTTGPPTGSIYGPPTSNMAGPPTGNRYGPPSGSTTSPPTGNISGHLPTGPPTGNLTGPPTANITTANMYGPPSGSMTGPPTGNISGPPTANMYGPPSGSMTSPPTGNISGPPTANMYGPPSGSMTGPPTANMTGPPTANITGPPTANMYGPPSGSMTGPPTGNISGPPTANMTVPPTANITGPPTANMTGPPPTRSMSGPLHPTGRPPPTTGAGLSAPSGQHYSRTVSSEAPNMGMHQPNVLGQPSYPSPPRGGLIMQKQLQLPELQPINLLEHRHILPSEPLQHPSPSLPGHLADFAPDPSVFCSSMNTVPATSGLLNKLKLPLAIHIHPFKDSKAKSCPVINPSVIVRCRVCRGYINPYVSFSDARHWRCNMCFRTNVVPEDYDYNPHSGKRGDRTHHAELRHSSVEYIAPSEYMVRPPQPSVYLYLIDVSYPAVESGLLGVFCRVLLECLSRLPGDGRTMVGFLTYDQHLHFYNLKSSQTQPQMLVVSDLNDVFIPSPHSLLVNLRESKELVKNLLEELPKMFAGQTSGDSALGAALQVAEKLLHPIGGRITVLQSSLPNVGPGSLKLKEQSQTSVKKDQLKMAASTDFYKKLAVECSAQQIAVDLFAFSSPRRFIDLATLSTMSKFSSGQISYYSDFHHTKETTIKTVEKDFRRYLTRNIGFEAVMRIRCTEGISLHTFHGNFFVRSTDLLSLPNVNPDHGFCMNLAIDENLKEYSTICCQAALLYTTYRGERRIRVHTLCLPVSEQLPQLYAGINVRAAATVLAKMAVDRMTTATLGDAREALLNTVQDSTKAYRSNLASSSSGFSLPTSLKLLPLYVLSILKHPSLTLNPNVMLDERAYAVNLILTLPLNYLLANVYPTLYALHTLSEKDVIDIDGEEVVSPSVLQLSAEKLHRNGVYLMDHGKGLYIWVSKDTPPDTVKQLLGVLHFGAIPEFTNEIPVLEYSLSKLVNQLIKQIKLSRQYYMPLLVIREDGSQRRLFVNKLLEDKTEDGTSYYELLSHVARQINK